MAMVMQNLGGGGGGGGGLSWTRCIIVYVKMVNGNFVFHLSLSNCRISFCLSNKDLTIKSNYGSQALSTPSRLRFPVW